MALLTITTKHLRLSQLRPLAPASVQSLAAAWDVRMVYESNSIEGNSLTLRETEMAISGLYPVSGSSKDQVAARNLFKAWFMLKELAKNGQPLKDADLLNCWRLLNGDEVDLTKPKPRPEIGLLLGLPEDSLERAALLHHRIIRYGYFGDFSGLIARLAMNFELLAAGYPPISISPADSSAYYDALKAADSGNFPAWLAFLSTRVEQELDSWLEALDSSLPEN